MTTVVIVIHLMVVVAMIGLILLQRSEGGALGIGGGQGAFLTGRSAGNVLSPTTAYLALAFFATSLGLAFIAKYQPRAGDILNRLPGQETPAAETPAPAAPPTSAPTSAEDLLKQLGGSSSEPQTPPTEGAATPSAGDATSAPTATPAPPVQQAPSPSPAPTPQPAPSQ